MGKTTCIKKIHIKQPHGGFVEARCGHCVGCKTWRQLAWTLRILLEHSTATSSIFLTLTYEDRYVPEKLEVEDTQLFLKRLRYYTNGNVRFFCCGEYGGKKGRPHWHLILLSTHDLSEHLGSNLGRCRISLWPKGDVHIGEVTPASVRYCARYALKTDPFKSDEYVVHMSRKPGLGLPRLREMATYLAKSQPEVAELPNWLRVGRAYYPLDARARKTMLEAYTNAGGMVLCNEYSSLRQDLEARLTVLRGEPCDWTLEGDKIIRLLRKSNVEKAKR